MQRRLVVNGAVLEVFDAGAVDEQADPLVIEDRVYYRAVLGAKGATWLIEDGGWPDPSPLDGLPETVEAWRGKLVLSRTPSQNYPGQSMYEELDAYLQANGSIEDKVYFASTLHWDLGHQMVVALPLVLGLDEGEFAALWRRAVTEN